jgi:hypothetical protein
MNKEFVTYEQALALKELGFNEPCFRYWNKTPFDKDFRLCYAKSILDSNEVNNSLVGRDPKKCAAPLYQQAFRWFREKYKLHSCVDFQQLKSISDDIDIDMYKFYINEQWVEGKDWFDYRYGFKHIAVSLNITSYREAELECLKKLIEIIKAL